MLICLWGTGFRRKVMCGQENSSMTDIVMKLYMSYTCPLPVDAIRNQETS